jgi:sugar lactone lactonase YvrE
MSTTLPTVLLDGLVFPESPRWYGGKLWFSDVYGHRVMTVDLHGVSETVAEFNERPSGLGFLPDGTPLVVLMESRQIVRLTPDGQRLHGDLSDIVPYLLNDMVVDGLGDAYVDCLMTPAHPGDPIPVTDQIALVTPTGECRIVLRGLTRPNGIAISADRQRLIFGSVSDAKIHTADIDHNGNLSGLRVFAETPADGICLDVDGAVWAGTVRDSQFRRVEAGGNVSDVIQLPEDKLAIACVLGGEGRNTLFMATAHASPQQLKEHGRGTHGFIETVLVQVPGAGTP